MKAADIEWSMLRGGLIGLAIALVLGIGMLTASYHFWESADKQLKRAQSQLRASRAKYRTVDEQEAMIATYYPQFVALEGQGIIGRERRLDWIENLRRADETLKLPRLAYSIDTQEPFEAQFPLGGGVYRPYASEMSLSLGLLHGQDLFNLLTRLEEAGQGLYSVDSCTLVRRRDTPGSPRAAHLTSECQLHWYTIRKPGEEGTAS
ncbi:MAG: hypothetical protein P8Y69_16010 [Gammaproteobacteria bacterium]